MLVLAQACDFTLEIFQPSAGEAIDYSASTLISLGVTTSKKNEGLHSRSMSPRLCFGPCSPFILVSGPLIRAPIPSP